MVNVKIKEAISPVQRKVRKLLKLFLGLNCLAFLITAYLSYLHYRPSASTLCKINEYWDCDIVNKSTYSEIFGIPVAILGLATYLFLLAMAWAILKGVRFTRWHKSLRALNLFWLLFGVVAAGVVFSGYLTYIELFVLEAICVFCLAQQIIIIVDLFVLLTILSMIDRGKKDHPEVCEFC